MEDLEKFHQLILFDIMDIKLPEWVNWITVDMNGELGIFEKEPDTCNNLREWNYKKIKNIEFPDGKGRPAHAQFVDDHMAGHKFSRRRKVQIPKGISWADCKWRYYG